MNRTQAGLETWIATPLPAAPSPVLWAVLVAAPLAWLPAAARAGEAPRSWRDFPGVRNTSFVEPKGDRALQLSIDVPATARAVYEAFTTSEGFSSWAVPMAVVDLRTGGSIESSYDPAAKPGDPGNIRNRILAYVPDRLLVLQNVQAPPGFPDPALFQGTVSIIELSPLSPASTRVTITNAGYGPGEGYARLYRNFEWGDAYELAELKARFERGPVDWRARAAAEKSRAASGTVQAADGQR